MRENTANDYKNMNDIKLFHQLRQQGDIEEAYKLLSVIEEKDDWSSELSESGLSKLISELQLVLGDDFSFGNETEENSQLAFELYMKSAERGNSTAQFCVGLSYQYGDGVKQNWALAVEWYMKAANQGDMYAQESLGFISDRKSREYAMFWYGKAAEQGNAEAQKKLRQLKSRFRITHLFYILAAIPAILLGILIDNNFSDSAALLFINENLLPNIYFLKLLKISPYYLVMLPVFFISLYIHELAHGFTAYKLGDDTNVNPNGRFSVNMVRYFSLPGIILFVLSGFGFARTFVNPDKFKSRKADIALVCLAGPVANFILAVLFALMLRFMLLNCVQIPKIAAIICFEGCWLNILLCFFNFIPVFPLDGSKIFAAFIPDKFLNKLRSRLDSLPLLAEIIFSFLPFILLILAMYAEPAQNILSEIEKTIFDYFLFIA